MRCCCCTSVLYNSGSDLQQNPGDPRGTPIRTVGPATARGTESGPAAIVRWQLPCKIGAACRVAALGRSSDLFSKRA